MGLFDSLVSVATSAMVGNSEQGQAIQLITQLVQQNGGDIGGLLGQLQQGGLGDALQSWIGNGANQAVSGGDVQNALGNHLQQAAQSVGLNVGDAGNVLSQYLPQIINAITPNGTAADADGFGLDDVLRIAQQFLK